MCFKNTLVLQSQLVVLSVNLNQYMPVNPFKEPAVPFFFLTLFVSYSLAICSVLRVEVCF